MKNAKYPNEKKFIDVWIFAVFAFAISFLLNWLSAVKQNPMLASLAPLVVGMLTFIFQLSVKHRPIIELYSKAYPYRKLKPYGVISAFLLFEFIIMWGLHTKQILFINEDLFLITLILVGVIAYYHLFVRMKISLRFLLLAIFIPVISAGASLGVGSYLKMLQFVTPTANIGHIVFFNTIYWVLFYIFLQVTCEEPAFRGYIMQRVLSKGELPAIIYSTAAYALWRIPFSIFIKGVYWNEILLLLCGNLIMGAVFALLFVKSKNLLVAIICHGIVDGLYKSFFAQNINFGVSQYIKFTAIRGGFQLAIIWFLCLFIGLILLTFVPRKKTYAH